VRAVRFGAVAVNICRANAQGTMTGLRDWGTTQVSSQAWGRRGRRMKRRGEGGGG